MPHGLEEGLGLLLCLLLQPLGCLPPGGLAGRREHLPRLPVLQAARGCLACLAQRSLQFWQAVALCDVAWHQQGGLASVCLSVTLAMPYFRCKANLLTE